MNEKQRQKKIEQARALLTEDAERCNEIIVIWPDGDGVRYYSTLPDDILDLIGSVAEVGVNTIMKKGKGG